VGFPDGELPIVIQLEGRHDTTEFWTQRQAISLLQSQLLEAVSDNIPARPVVTEPLPPKGQPPGKMSLFGRKQSKAPQPKEVQPEPAGPPVVINVEVDQVNFRTETEYGLYETLRGHAVLLAVHIK